MTAHNTIIRTTTMLYLLKILVLLGYFFFLSCNTYNIALANPNTHASININAPCINVSIFPPKMVILWGYDNGVNNAENEPVDLARI